MSLTVSANQLMKKGIFPVTAGPPRTPSQQNTLTAWMHKDKGQNESGVYTIKPNDLEPFEVRLYAEEIMLTIAKIEVNAMIKMDVLFGLAGLL